MKKLRKVGRIAIPAVAIAVAGAGSYMTYDKYGAQDNTLTLANVEALTSDGEQPGDQEPQASGWYLHHFDCKITVNATARVKLLSLIPIAKATAEGNVNLTPLTQYFNHYKGEDGTGPCAEGTQVTCSDVSTQALALLNLDDDDKDDKKSKKEDASQKKKRNN